MNNLLIIYLVIEISILKYIKVNQSNKKYIFCYFF